MTKNQKEDKAEKTSELTDSFSEAPSQKRKPKPAPKKADGKPRKLKSQKAKASKAKKQKSESETSESSQSLSSTQLDSMVLKEKSIKFMKQSETMPFIRKPLSKRLVLLVSNAEPLDSILSKWTDKCFVDGRYTIVDMNQALTLPKRPDPVNTFADDSPLTQVGSRMADLFGRSLVENGVVISRVYSSPSLCCIETAVQICRAQATDIKVRVEPQLFDQRSSSGRTPRFMTVDELRKAGLAVDTNYRSQRKSTAKSGEATNQFAQFVDSLATPEISTVLVVTHPNIVHALAGTLNGSAKQNKSEHKVAKGFSYCSGLAFAQRESADPKQKSKWRPFSNVIPNFKSTNFVNRQSAFSLE
ncbi:Ubiquitin-associated and SH3 domain-containing protein A isoform X2 [Aphelenchoides besseyi]|nr:Ubiquitin-associated and SH3 domain-containing protein A isoform X2 [Aphelenchoides besseyi]